MGLDMYLYLSKYESKHTYGINDEGKYGPVPYDKNFYPKELKPLTESIASRDFLSKNTKYLVGYWRKFNALHNYIVKNLADGEDKCQEIYMSDEAIDKIIDVLEQVSNNHSEAPRLLPPTTGFFFGSQDFDDWYFRDIEYSLELFKKVKEIVHQEEEKKNYFDVIYRASW